MSKENQISLGVLSPLQTTPTSTAETLSRSSGGISRDDRIQEASLVKVYPSRLRLWRDLIKLNSTTSGIWMDQVTFERAHDPYGTNVFRKKNILTQHVKKHSTDIAAYLLSSIVTLEGSSRHRIFEFDGAYLTPKGSLIYNHDKNGGKFRASEQEATSFMEKTVASVRSTEKYASKQIQKNGLYFNAEVSSCGQSITLYRLNDRSLENAIANCFHKRKIVSRIRFGIMVPKQISSLVDKKAGNISLSHGHEQIGALTTKDSGIFNPIKQSGEKSEVISSIGEVLRVAKRSREKYQKALDQCNDLCSGAFDSPPGPKKQCKENRVTSEYPKSIGQCVETRWRLPLAPVQLAGTPKGTTKINSHKQEIQGKDSKAIAKSSWKVLNQSSQYPSVDQAPLCFHAQDKKSNDLHDRSEATPERREFTLWGKIGAKSPEATKSNSEVKTIAPFSLAKRTAASISNVSPAFCNTD